MKEEPTITMKISDFVRYHLGQGMWHDRPIKMEHALIIHQKCRNSATCHIQFADKDDRPLKEPLLHDYAAWKESAELFFRQKAQSHKIRVESFLLEENVRRVSRAYAEYSDVDGPTCEIVARKLLISKKFQNIKGFYSGKLVEKEEEL